MFRAEINRYYEDILLSGISLNFKTILFVRFFSGTHRCSSEKLNTLNIKSNTFTHMNNTHIDTLYM